MTARKEILEVARDLTARGMTPFSPMDVIRQLNRQGTRYPESTLRTHIVDAMCVNAPGPRAGMYPDLRRVGRGEYVLADDNAPDRPPRGVAAPPSKPITEKRSHEAVTERPWSWEANVQAVLVQHLRASGWEVVSTADTGARQQGPDVLARRDGVDLVVEVKGYPHTPKTSVHTQARHYVGGALLTALLAWGDRPQARIGLAFPEAMTYRKLVQRLRTPLEALHVSVWFVHEDEHVEPWLDCLGP